MQRIATVIALAILCTTLLNGCTTTNPTNNQEAANEALVTRFYTEYWNQGDDSVLEELFTVPGYVHKEYGDEDFIPQTYEELAARFDAARLATPDIAYQIIRLFSEENEVMAQWTATGTFTGDLPGYPADEEEIIFSGITIWVIQDGKFIESFTEDDDQDLLDQMTD